MRSFDGIPAFLGFMVGLRAEIDRSIHKGLEQAAKIVEAEAKAEIGRYQGAAAPFAAWPPLQPATIARKATGDSPLLETGAMRDSIEHSVGHMEAVVGSNDPKALWQELGTGRIPPRSFLGMAVIHKEKQIAEVIGGGFVGGLTGGKMKISITGGS